MDFKYDSEGNTYKYIEKSYDPFSDQKKLLYYKIWDVLRNTMECTYFPVKLYFDDKLVDSISSQLLNELEGQSLDRQYRFRFLSAYEIELWDIRTCTWMVLCLREEYQSYRNQYFFKGMELKNDPRINVKGIWLKANFYGLDTKKTLALDRKRIRQEAIEEIHKIVDSAITFFLDKIEKNLLKQSGEIKGVEYNQIYTYWCIVSLENKVRLLKDYKKVFKKIQVPITVLVKKEEGFLKEEYDFKIDKNFTEVIKYTILSKIMIISDGDNTLHLISHSTQSQELPDVVNEETKNYLLNSLLKKNDSGIHRSFYTESMRRYIIGIKEYAQLCTNMVPFGIAGEWYYIGYIISPITIYQWESARHLKEDDFVSDICSREEFLNLVNHVYAHQIEGKKYSKEEIIKNYEKLIKDMYEINKRK